MKLFCTGQTLWIDKRQKGVRSLTSNQQDEGIPPFQSFFLQPIILCLPIQKVQLHPELGWDVLWKPKQHQGKLFLGRCDLICCPSPQTNTSSRFLQTEFKALILSHQTSCPWECSENAGAPALLVQGDETVSPGCQLEVSAHPALQSHLVGPSNALKDALGQQGCHRSREGGTFQPSCLTGLVHGDGRFTDSYSFYFWISVSAWKAVPALLQKQENWARNAKIIRTPNPNFIPFLHISRSIFRNISIFSLKLNSQS